MIYNTTHKFTKVLEEVAQEDIYNMPEYFAMSRDEVIKSGCPEFLKNLLNSFPWKDRPNVIQIRPQDWRKSKPVALGDGWHVDMNVRLRDGKNRVARDIYDWRLLVASFGGVVSTDFISTPLDLPDLTSYDHGKFFGQDLLKHTFEIHSSKPNQIAEYSSRDIHRMGQKYTLGRFRLMIVAFESSDVIGDGVILPSLKDKDNGNTIKLSDYIM